MSMRLIEVLGWPLWWLLSWCISKREDYLVVCTYPDFDDSVRALLESPRAARKKIILLTVSKAKYGDLPFWLRDRGHVGVVYRYSVRGVWAYHRAKFVVFSHGLFSSWEPSPRQVVVNMWHGMPIKRIGLLDGKPLRDIPRFHYTIAYDERFQEIISAAFGVEKERVLVCGHPRLDILGRSGGLSRLGLPPHKSLFVWLPTYRESVVGDTRSDGDVGVDIFGGEYDLSVLNEVFGRHGSICIVKPHPMASARREDFDRYQNIVFVDDAQLRFSGVSLYEVLGATDCLITDVSSVYFDWKRCGKPVMVFCPDLLEYEGTRGFVAPIGTLIDDEIIMEGGKFIERLEAMLANADLHGKETSVPEKIGGEAERFLRLIGVV